MAGAALARQRLPISLDPRRPEEEAGSSLSLAFCKNSTVGFAPLARAPKAVAGPKGRSTLWHPNNKRWHPAQGLRRAGHGDFSLVLRAAKAAPPPRAPAPQMPLWTLRLAGHACQHPSQSSSPVPLSCLVPGRRQIPPPDPYQTGDSGCRRPGGAGAHGGRSQPRGSRRKRKCLRGWA